MIKKTPRWNTIGFKFSTMVIVMGLLLIAGVMALAVNRNLYNMQIYEDRKAERQQSFRIVSSLESQPLKGVTVENTYWDDMVQFIQQPNPQFESEIFGAQLESYDASGIWVYNTEYELISNYTNKPDSSMEYRLELSREQIDGLFRESFLTHFYRNTPSGIIEVYGATVHDSNDVAHASEPKGYFFIARALDTAYINRLQNETNDIIEIVSPESPLVRSSIEAETGQIIFTQPLKGIDNKPVAYLAVSYESSAIASLFESLNKSISLLILGVIVLTGTVYWFVRRVIIDPLNKIYGALESDNNRSLSGLMDQNTEFGRIAKLIEKSQRQKHEIIENAKLMEQAQASLQARSKEVETINSLMVDRELRMIDLKQQVSDFQSRIDQSK